MRTLVVQSDDGFKLAYTQQLAKLEQPQHTTPHSQQLLAVQRSPKLLRDCHRGKRSMSDVIDQLVVGGDVEFTKH